MKLQIRRTKTADFLYNIIMTLKEKLLKYKMPVGLSDFEEIIDKNRCYADKTLFIRDIIESESKVILFTRPRRFGKTLNMSMLKTFFEKPTEGKDTSHYFKNLKIWQQGEKYRDEQGKRPVIYITFRGSMRPMTRQLNVFWQSTKDTENWKTAQNCIRTTKIFIKNWP